MRAFRLPTVLVVLLLASGAVLLASEASPARHAPGLEPGPSRVVFLGDSLTFGQGLASRAQAYPAMLAERLAAADLPIEAINAGVSGDTSADGLRRLAKLLSPKPDVLVLALGANDATHGQSAAAARDNLRTIVERARRAGARVLLAGLKLPASLGVRDTGAFDHLWTDLARDLELPLVPDIMDGVFDTPGMVQADGVHPTVAGQQRIARNVEPFLLDVLRSLKP